jgi:hypothetical protein
LFGLGLGGPGGEIAGVVDEDVETAEMLSSAMNDFVDVALVGDVGGKSEGMVASLAREFFERPMAAADEDDTGAFPGESERNGAADAGAGAGDDGDFVVEAQTWQGKSVDGRQSTVDGGARVL